MKKNNNFRNTLIITFGLILLVVLFDIYVQLSSQNKIVEKCSYLDPILIDLLAFGAGFFLFIEGFYKIYINKEVKIKEQITRILRVVLGASIITLHVIQFLHK